MTGMEAWSLIAPILAAHSPHTLGKDGKYHLTPIDEAYVLCYGALKLLDEKEKSDGSGTK